MKSPIHTIYAVFVLALIGPSCSESSPVEPADPFWTWFSENADRFSETFGLEKLKARFQNPEDERKRKSEFAEIASKLKEANPDFSPAFAGDDPEIRQFIVSVMGKTELFDEVDAFVAKAPVIKGWEIVALKPPVKTDGGWVINAGTFQIPLAKSRFVATRNEVGKYDVVLYLADGLDTTTRMAVGLSRNLTRDLLGERLTGELLGEVKLDDLKNAPTEALKYLEIEREFRELSKAKP